MAGGLDAEESAARSELRRSLVAGGLAGVELVISDANGGIKAAVATVLADDFSQLSRMQFMADLASRVPRASWPMVATLVGSICEQPERDTAWCQLGKVVERLGSTGFSDAASFVLDAADDILAFAGFPTEQWAKIRSSTPHERSNRKFRRPTDRVGIFPNRPAVIRLVGAILAEQTDAWAVTERHMSVESAKSTASSELRSADPGPTGELAAG